MHPTCSTGSAASSNSASAVVRCSWDKASWSGRAPLTVRSRAAAGHLARKLRTSSSSPLAAAKWRGVRPAKSASRREKCGSRQSTTAPRTTGAHTATCSRLRPRLSCFSTSVGSRATYVSSRCRSPARTYCSGHSPRGSRLYLWKIPKWSGPTVGIHPRAVNHATTSLCRWHIASCRGQRLKSRYTIVCSVCLGPLGSTGHSSGCSSAPTSLARARMASMYGSWPLRAAKCRGCRPCRSRCSMSACWARASNAVTKLPMSGWLQA
mmetsp:Transcript_65026/g.115732  ORF Transcript_65026/g.115732 Transcript_65026/m.115732 type:complete len:265 (-) Transcript_65026:229-1023(-)